MFNLFCCTASGVADKATEVLEAAHVKVVGAANEFTLKQLEYELLNAVTQVHEAPDVFVTVTDITLKDGVGLSSLTSFRIKGLLCRVEVKVQGTAGQMAGMVAAHHAGKLFSLVGQGERAIAGALGVSHTGFADKASASAAEAKASLAGSAAAGQESKSVDFEIVLDLEKVAGVEEVQTKAVAVTSSHDAINKVMSVGMIEKYVEIAVSRRVSQAVIEWQNNTFTLEKAKAKGGELVSAGVTKGGDLVSAGVKKGGAVMDNARAAAGR